MTIADFVREKRKGCLMSWSKTGDRAMRIFLLVIVCFIFSGCFPTTTLVFVNNSNSKLALLAYAIFDPSVVRNDELSLNDKYELLTPQGLHCVLQLTTDAGEEYTYQLESKKGGWLHYYQYYIVAEDMSIYVYDKLPKKRKDNKIQDGYTENILPSIPDANAPLKAPTQDIE